MESMKPIEFKKLYAVIIKKGPYGDNVQFFETEADCDAYIATLSEIMVSSG